MSSPAVTWLGDKISNDQHYQTFKFKKIIASVGDFVLISNADAAEPDTEEGCDVAKILGLYENVEHETDPFRAKVQWYSKPQDLPAPCLNNPDTPIFFQNEVIEDRRPFDSDVSIETFFKKCYTALALPNINSQNVECKPYCYLCRYRLVVVSKKKALLEPVLEEEKENVNLLNTPKKMKYLAVTLNRLNLSDHESWSVTRTDDTKMMIKRSILTAQQSKCNPKEDAYDESGERMVKETVNSGRRPRRASRNSITYKEEDLSPVKNTPNRSHRKSLSEKYCKDIQLTPKNLKASMAKSIIYEEGSSQAAYRTKSNFNAFISEKSNPKHNIESTPETYSLKMPDELEELPTLIIKRERSCSPQRRMSIDYNSPIKSNRDDSKTGRARKSALFETKESPLKLRNLSRLSGRTPTPLRKSFNEANCIVKRRTSSRLIDTTPPKSNNVRKSVRTIRKSIKYEEDEISPVKKTPKSSPRKRSLSVSSDDDFQVTPRTPRRKNVTPLTPLSKTPRSVRGTPVSRKIKTSQLTPSLQTRTHSIKNIKADPEVNNALPGRETHVEDILSFVRTKLLDEVSGCMYISGVPGTGKTATVCAAVNILKTELDLPNFQLVEVNGLRISEPRQVYVQIYKQLTGKSLAWAQACSLLEQRFTKHGPRRVPTVLLVDELDTLCTRKQDVLYNLMEWATHDSALLTVLAVANAMDLPERVMAARVASRLGLTRLNFQPYTYVQLERIVATKLAKAKLTPDAMQLIARKVAAVSGDARRALALCDRAVELSGPGSAGLAEVQKALAETYSSAVVRAIRSCSRAEKLMLRAVAAEVERTGSDQTTLSRALISATDIVSLDGRPYRTAVNIRAPSSGMALEICSRLSASNLLILEPKGGDPRLLLNVTTDDVHYACRQIIV